MAASIPFIKSAGDAARRTSADVATTAYSGRRSRINLYEHELKMNPHKRYRQHSFLFLIAFRASRLSRRTGLRLHLLPAAAVGFPSAEANRRAFPGYAGTAIRPSLRARRTEALITSVPDAGIPESFNVLVKELKSLGLNVDLDNQAA
jgi:hypothetical protein